MTLSPNTPYGGRVADYLPLLREITGVLLIVAGLLGLVWVAFAWDWRIGVAALSALAVVCGYGLGTPASRGSAQ